MQCCSSECIVAVKFEAHPIFKQVLLFRVHKHASIARLANCRPVPLYNLFSIEFHDHSQTLLSFTLLSMFVGPYGTRVDKPT